MHAGSLGLSYKRRRRVHLGYAHSDLRIGQDWPIFFRGLCANPSCPDGCHQSSSLSAAPRHPTTSSDRHVCIQVDKDVRVICQPYPGNIATAGGRKLDGPHPELVVLAPKVPGCEDGAICVSTCIVWGVARLTGPPIPSLSQSGASRSSPKYVAKSIEAG